MHTGEDPGFLAAVARQVPKEQERAVCRTNLSATRAGGRHADVAEVPALCGRHPWHHREAERVRWALLGHYSPTAASCHTLRAAGQRSLYRLVNVLYVTFTSLYSNREGTLTAKVSK